MTKTSMSVRDMGKSLGLGKTDSYWLVKKNYFEVRIVAGKMRVMIESFENWYANQIHYKKVDGELPGSAFEKTTIPISEVSKIMGISEATVYDHIKRGHFKSVHIGYRTRIDRQSFEMWYGQQQCCPKEKTRKEDTDV